MKKFYSRLAGKKLLIVLLGLVCAGSVWATDVTTDILTPTTWDISGSPYILKAAITVTNSGSLTINPGVVVQFSAKYDGGISLTIAGTLIAKGKADSVITFSGDRSSVINGSFGRYISGPLTIQSGSNCELQYVVIDGLGYGTNYSNPNTAAIVVNSSDALINHCKFQNILATGLLFTGAYTKTLLVDSFINNTIGIKFRGTQSFVDTNVFTANTDYDVITGFDNLNKLLPSNTFMNKGIGVTADIAITKNDTMSYITSQYILLEENTIPQGKNLIIQPRNLFVFPAKYDGGLALHVEGNLIAKGTDTSFITFKGDRNTVINGSFGRYISGPVYFGIASNSIMQYVLIDGLGFGTNYRSYSTAALDISISNCDISNCIIQNILGVGVFYHNFSNKRFLKNTFQNNTVGIKFGNISPFLDSDTFTINTDYDLLTGFYNLSKILPNTTFMDAGIGITHDLPVGKNDTMYYITSRYVLIDANTIPVSKVLTIQLGVLFQFPAKYDGGLNLTIGGTLIAKGTSDSYITFQGDGSTIDNGSFGRYISGPIYFTNTSQNSLLQYTIINSLGFGTNYKTDNTAALDISSSSCTILNCNIQNIRGSGIAVRNSSPYVAGSCFYTNRGGIYATGGKAKVLHSNFVGNTSFGVKNISTVDTVDATECWWNNPSGPNGGDNVSGNVIYDPYATDQPYDCSDPTILPLTLLNFQTTLSNNIVNCTWQTATETNTSYFIIQRSTDGTNFTSLGKVYASGNSSINKSYSFTDKSPNNGINYYRLQMVDINGKYSYSKAVPINISIKQPFAIYPNPVKDVLYVQVQRSIAEKVSLQIIDMQGEIVVQQNKQLSAGITTLSVNTNTLAKGSYFMVIKGQTTEKKLFIKE